MSLVIVGAALTWWFLMGGKDFVWDMIKLVFGGDLAKSIIPEKEDDIESTTTDNNQQNERKIFRKSEPIVRKPLLQLESEERLPMNAYLGKRIQPRI